MSVADEVAWLIVNHDPFVERVESCKPILPALLLSPEVEGIKASKVEHWCRILGWGHSERSRGTGGGSEHWVALERWNIMSVYTQIMHCRPWTGALSEQSTNAKPSRVQSRRAESDVRQSRD